MKEKESAVSPVVGIMLLLAITIIAAGVFCSICRSDWVSFRTNTIGRSLSIIIRFGG